MARSITTKDYEHTSGSQAYSGITSSERGGGGQSAAPMSTAEANQTADKAGSSGTGNQYSGGPNAVAPQLRQGASLPTGSAPLKPGDQILGYTADNVAIISRASPLSSGGGAVSSTGGSGVLPGVTSTPIGGSGGGGVPVSSLVPESLSQTQARLNALQQNLIARGASQSDIQAQVAQLRDISGDIRIDPSTGRAYALYKGGFQSLPDVAGLESQTNLLQRISTGTVTAQDLIPKGSALPATPENRAAIEQIMLQSEANKSKLAIESAGGSAQPVPSIVRISPLEQTNIQSVLNLGVAKEGTTGGQAYIPQAATFVEGLRETGVAAAQGAKTVLEGINSLPNNLGVDLIKVFTPQQIYEQSATLQAPAKLAALPQEIGQGTKKIVGEAISVGIPTIASTIGTIRPQDIREAFTIGQPLKPEETPFTQTVRSLTPEQLRAVKTVGVGATAILAAPTVLPLVEAAFEPLALGVSTADVLGTTYGAYQTVKGAQQFIASPSIGTGIDVATNAVLTSLVPLSAASKAIEEFVTPKYAVDFAGAKQTQITTVASKIEPVNAQSFEQGGLQNIQATAQEARATQNAVVIPLTVQQFGQRFEYSIVVPREVATTGRAEYNLAIDTKTGLPIGTVSPDISGREQLFAPYIVPKGQLIIAGEGTPLENPSLFFAGRREAIINAAQEAAVADRYLSSRKAQSALLLEQNPDITLDTRKSLLNFIETAKPQSFQVIEEQPFEVLKSTPFQTKGQLLFKGTDKTSAVITGDLTTISGQRPQVRISQSKIRSDVATSEFNPEDIFSQSQRRDIAQRVTTAQSDSGFVIESVQTPYDVSAETMTLNERIVPGRTTVKTVLTQPGEQTFSIGTDVFSEGSSASRRVETTQFENTPASQKIEPFAEEFSQNEFGLGKSKGTTGELKRLTGEVAFQEPDVESIAKFTVQGQKQRAGIIPYDAEYAKTATYRDIELGAGAVEVGDNKAYAYALNKLAEETAKARQKTTLLLTSETDEIVSKELARQSNKVFEKSDSEKLNAATRFVERDVPSGKSSTVIIEEVASSPEAEVQYAKVSDVSRLTKTINTDFATDKAALSDLLATGEQSVVSSRSLKSVLSPNVASSVSQNTRSASEVFQESSQILKQSNVLKQVSIPKTVTIAKPSSLTKPIQISESATKPLSKTAEKLLQEQASRLQTKVGIPSIPSIQVPKQPEKKTPEITIPLSGDIEKKTYAEDVYVRQKGKDIKVNKKPQMLADAEDLGSDVTDNTPARTFKLVKTNKPAGPPETTHKFDPERYTVKKDGTVFVQKAKYAISSQGEKQGITVKGWQARHDKAIKNQMLGDIVKTAVQKKGKKKGAFEL